MGCSPAARTLGLSRSSPGVSKLITIGSPAFSSSLSSRAVSGPPDWLGGTPIVLVRVGARESESCEVAWVAAREVGVGVGAAAGGGGGGGEREGAMSMAQGRGGEGGQAGRLGSRLRRCWSRKGGGSQRPGGPFS